MAKFTGKNAAATFGGDTWSCITSIEASETADVYSQGCAGSDYKVRVVGTTDATITINYLADDGGSEQSDFRPGTSGTFSVSMNGTYGPDYSGTGIIESHNVSAPVEGFVTGTVVIGIDGALTVA